MTPESSPWQEHKIRERANIWGSTCAKRVQEDHRREALFDMEDFAFAVCFDGCLWCLEGIALTMPRWTQLTTMCLEEGRRTGRVDGVNDAHNDAEPSFRLFGPMRRIGGRCNVKEDPLRLIWPLYKNCKRLVCDALSTMKEGRRARVRGNVERWVKLGVNEYSRRYSAAPSRTPWDVATMASVFAYVLLRIAARWWAWATGWVGMRENGDR